MWEFSKNVRLLCSVILLQKKLWPYHVRANLHDRTDSHCLKLWCLTYDIVMAITIISHPSDMCVWSSDKKSIGFRVGVFRVTFLSWKGQNVAVEMLGWIVDHGCVVPGEKWAGARRKIFYLFVLFFRAQTWYHLKCQRESVFRLGQTPSFLIINFPFSCSSSFFTLSWKIVSISLCSY